MPAYNIVHFQNCAAQREPQYAAWQRQELARAILEQQGFVAVQFMSLQPVQLQPANPQPWRFCALYELEAAAGQAGSLLAVFSALARRAGKESGLLEDDVAHVFELTRPHLPTPNPIDETAPLHVAFVMGNCIEGKEVEYDRWYDEVHSPEVLGTPDFVAMRRGRLAPLQAAPGNEQPANRLVLLQIRSRDLHASIREFIARAEGTSPSGVKWVPREAAAGFASLKRTTHVFTPFSPRLTSAWSSQKLTLSRPMKKWMCVNCGYMYDEALGDPANGLAPGTRWADVPEDWICPDCGMAKADFEMVEQ
jgi:rubredoxin